MMLTVPWDFIAPPYPHMWNWQIAERKKKKNTARILFVSFPFAFFSLLCRTNFSLGEGVYRTLVLTRSQKLFTSWTFGEEFNYFEYIRWKGQLQRMGEHLGLCWSSNRAHSLNVLKFVCDDRFLVRWVHCRCFSRSVSPLQDLYTIALAIVQ